MSAGLAGAAPLSARQHSSRMQADLREVAKLVGADGQEDQLEQRKLEEALQSRKGKGKGRAGRRCFLGLLRWRMTTETRKAFYRPAPLPGCCSRWASSGPGRAPWWKAPQRHKSMPPGWPGPPRPRACPAPSPASRRPRAWRAAHPPRRRCTAGGLALAGWQAAQLAARRQRHWRQAAHWRRRQLRQQDSPQHLISQPPHLQLELRLGGQLRPRSIGAQELHCQQHEPASGREVVIHGFLQPPGVSGSAQGPLREPGSVNPVSRVACAALQLPLPLEACKAEYALLLQGRLELELVSCCAPLAQQA